MVQKTVSRPAKRRSGVRKAAAEKAPQPTAPRRRGRPRAYEPDVALARALDVFWRVGFAATSLDALSAATGMNRPSLYAAFGDKRDIYVKAYERYRDRGRQRMGEVLKADLPLPEALMRLYDIAIDMYVSGTDGPRGCFSVMTATSEAMLDPVIGELAVAGLAEMDRAFARLLRVAQEKGELPASVDPGRLSRLATAAIHTLAVRARLGLPRAELDTIAGTAVDLICKAGRS